MLTSIVEYLLGFFALTVFGMLAFGRGPQTSATWRTAFLLGACIAVVELVLLYRRTTPANRLILGANIWLIGGGLAFLSEQWWLLDVYERWGVTGLLSSIALTGIVATVASPAGFVAADGPHRSVRSASVVLLAAALAALGYSIAASGNSQSVAVLLLTCLAWLARALRVWVGQQLKN